MPQSTFRSGEFIAKLTLTAAFIGAGAMIYFLRQLVLVIFVAIILALFWDTVADSIQKRSPFRISRLPALGIGILVNFGIFALALILLYSPLSTQFESFVTQLPGATRNAWMQLQPILRRFGLDLIDPSNWDLGNLSGNIFQSGVAIVGAGIQGVISLLTLLFVAIFSALDPQTYRNGFLDLLPKSKRLPAAKLMDALAGTLKQWMKATGLSMLSIGLLVTALLLALGVPYALLFGAMAGLFDIVPFLGPFVAFIGPLIMALSVSTAKAAWVVVGWVGVQMIESHIVFPYFMKREASLPPVITILMVVGMGQLFGILGAFLAAPTTACLVVLKNAVLDRDGNSTKGIG